MRVTYRCAGANCPQEFSDNFPLNVLNSHFFQNRVVICPACGLKQLLEPPQPAVASVIRVDDVEWDIEGYRLEERAP